MRVTLPLCTTFPKKKSRFSLRATFQNFSFQKIQRQSPREKKLSSFSFWVFEFGKLFARVFWIWSFFLDLREICGFGVFFFNCRAFFDVAISIVFFRMIFFFISRIFFFSPPFLFEPNAIPVVPLPFFPPFSLVSHQP